MKKDCKYCLPCGWCDRQNKQCEMKAPATGVATLTPVEPTVKPYDDGISSKRRTCGSCNYTDGCVYTSNPPKVKCQITGRYHYMDDECDCDTVTVTG